MNPSKLPGARVITPILWIILAGGLVLSVALHIWRSQPSRQEIVKQLNESAGLIGSAAGVKVRFE